MDGCTLSAVKAGKKMTSKRKLDGCVKNQAGIKIRGP